MIAKSILSKTLLLIILLCKTLFLILLTLTIAFFILNESYDKGDEVRKKDTGRFLFKIETSSLRKFVETQTLVFTFEESCKEFLLWCEDRVFSIFTTEPPIIQQIEN